MPIFGANLRALDKGNAMIVFVSTDFDEGAQLMIAFGGITATLRYSTGV
jgi:peptide chain release factor subunit 1